MTGNGENGTPWICQDTPLAKQRPRNGRTNRQTDGRTKCDRQEYKIYRRWRCLLPFHSQGCAALVLNGPLVVSTVRQQCRVTLLLLLLLRTLVGRIFSLQS